MTKQIPKRGSSRTTVRQTYLALSVIVVALGVILSRLPERIEQDTSITDDYPDMAIDREIRELDPSTQPGTGLDAQGDGAVEVAIAQGDEAIDPPDPIPLYIIVDDVGNNIEPLLRFLELPMALTFAVLPQRTYTTQSIELIEATGNPPILHQPMEAIGSNDPGEGALMDGMTRIEVHETLEKNLEAFPSILGINNHMGSLVTSNLEMMRHVMQFLNERQMYFIDSATTERSVAGQAAAELGVKFGRRTGVFLDNEDNVESVRAAIESSLDQARSDGEAILIGHVQSATLFEVLAEEAASIVERGYTFKHISEYPFISN